MTIATYDTLSLAAAGIALLISGLLLHLCFAMIFIRRLLGELTVIANVNRDILSALDVSPVPDCAFPECLSFGGFTYRIVEPDVGFVPVRVEDQNVQSTMCCEAAPVVSGATSPEER